MSELHSVVCVKVVPKPEEVRVDPHTRLLDRMNARSEINPPDMNALEMALGLKDRCGGRISLLSMGPAAFEPYLRVGLAMGCDHIYLLSDRLFAGADTLATTYTLAQAVRKIGKVDLIFCGEESSDGATGQVPSGLAEWLDIPQLTLITEIDLLDGGAAARGRREIKGGYEILEAPLPCLVSVKTAANEPRFMDYRLKPLAFEPPKLGEPGNLTLWTAGDLAANPQFIGLAGSPTWVSELAQAPSRERKRIFLEGSAAEIAVQVLKLLQENL